MLRVNRNLISLVLAACLVASAAALHYDYDKLYRQSSITYGSAIRLESLSSKFFLYSVDVKYGQGSGQHIVSAQQDEEAEGSLWYLKEAHGKSQISTGKTI